MNPTAGYLTHTNHTYCKGEETHPQDVELKGHSITYCPTVPAPVYFC